MRSRLETVRNKVNNSISSVFTKEDILTILDTELIEAEESRRILVNEDNIDTLKRVIQGFVEDFCFDDFIEIDEDGIKLSVYEREIEVDYEGAARMGSGFTERLTDDLTDEITHHLFEVI